MKFHFIREHRQEFSLSGMCRVLDVSRSGFFAWLKRVESRRKREDATLLRRIREIFLGSKGTYGSPRIWAELMTKGWRVSRKRVARLMRLAGIYAIRKQGYRRRKKVGSGDSGGAQYPAARFLGHRRQSEVAGGHRLHRHQGRLAPSRGGHGRLLAPDCGLVYEPQSQQPPGAKCSAHGCAAARLARSTNPS